MANVDGRSWASGARARISPRAFTLVELLVVIGVMSILLALLLPAVQAARGAARRTACQNQLRQIALAAHTHVDARGRLPAGTDPDTSATPYRGWLVPLLPFLEETATANLAAEEYRASLDPFDMASHPTFSKPIALFACPEDARASIAQPVPRYRMIAGLTSYLGSSGRDATLHDGVLYSGSATRFADVLDGVSRTLLTGERPPSTKFDLGWWYAGMGVGVGDGALDHTVGTASTDRSPYGLCRAATYPFQPGSLTDECSANHFWSLHPGGGGNFAFLDGAVRFFSYDAATILVDLSTRAGGETTAAE
jgi:prepilin-type N-terminal cleavage/methylation domain-containing protein/prepilin-type processing-associated H-X9-DG protein